MSLLATILLLITAAGCSDSVQPENTGIETTITASFTDQTRTYNDGMNTRWSNTDQLSVFVNEGKFYTNCRFSHSESNLFSGILPNIAQLRKLYAVYPYSEQWHSPEALNIDVNSAPVQNGNGSMSHLAGPGFPLYGVSGGSMTPTFMMNQLLSVGRFNITNDDDAPIKVKSITFTAPVSVAGEFTVDITGDTPTYTPVTGSSKSTVTLKVDGGQEIACKTTAAFYAGFVPFDVTGDFNIQVIAEKDGKEVVSSKAIMGKKIALEAGSIATLNYSFVPDAPVEKYIGKFNLVNENMDAYMAEAEKQYTDSNWLGLDGKNRNTYGLSIVKNYPNGDNGDLSDDPAVVTAYSYDRPLPVIIPIEGQNGQTVAVTVTGDGKYASETYKLTSTVKNSKVEVYNLIPGRRYHYIVTQSGSELSRGYFDTEGRRRILKVSDVVSADNANNFRDFGGLKTTDGRRIAYGKVFRGTNMDGLTKEEKAYMTDVLNIGLDVDLRRLQETGRNQAKRILDPAKAEYSNAGFINFNDLITPDKIKPTLLAILDALQKGKAVYIHCFAGADRTGCISMALEAVCGVSEKDCTIDYELTSFSCVSTRARTVYNSGFMGYFHPHLASRTGSTFQDKGVKFLKECGLADTQITALQDALTEDDD